MKSAINRRTLFVAAGSAVVAMTAGGASAQSGDMRGAVEFAGGKVIPKGQIEISLEDPSVQEKGYFSDIKTRVKSDGGSEKIAFALAVPAGAAASPTLQVVARLERDDGWLLARGSTKAEAGAPVSITLNTAMY
ncbi:hypothetical protein [uncultured Roseobacter sp.]|uniref:hypothetical protein n=1 Tax=uncultured Roseobacter sp. TaxID=114847 RepID=UPI002609A104|nr:hypothetical protein [uncultured Roseobacter sp.]